MDGEGDGGTVTEGRNRRRGRTPSDFQSEGDNEFPYLWTLVIVYHRDRDRGQRTVSTHVGSPRPRQKGRSGTRGLPSRPTLRRDTFHYGLILRCRRRKFRADVFTGRHTSGETPRYDFKATRRGRPHDNHKSCVTGALPRTITNTSFTST